MSRKPCAILLALTLLLAGTVWGSASELSTPPPPGESPAAFGESPTPPAEEAGESKVASLSLCHTFNGTIGAHQVLEATIPRPVGATSIQIYYSLDGETFLPYERPDPAEAMPSSGEEYTFTCFLDTDPPLEDFVAGRLDQFWVKLHIVGSVYEGDTETVLFQRAVVDPEHPSYLADAYSLAMRPLYLSSMRSSNPRDPAGYYRIEVPEGTTKEVLLELLPSRFSQQVEMYLSTEDIPIGKLFWIQNFPYDAHWEVPEDLDSLAIGEHVLTGSSSSPIKDSVLQVGSEAYLFDPPANSAPLKLVVTIAKRTPPVTIVPPPSSSDDSDDNHHGIGGNRGDVVNDDKNGTGVREGLSSSSSSRPPVSVPNPQPAELPPLEVSASSQPAPENPSSAPEAQVTPTQATPQEQPQPPQQSPGQSPLLPLGGIAALGVLAGGGTLIWKKVLKKPE